MSKEKKVIEKKNYVASFVLTGKAVVNGYTLKTDEKSEKSNWNYSSMNLGVDCGEKHGTVYAQMMGGYSGNGGSVIYAHGKNEDGSDDFENKIIVDWDDRNDPHILESIGDLCFITVGIEKTDKDKTYYKKFLSEYDAIAYCKEHLEDGMVITVRGNIRYSTYNDTTQVQKNITSIALSKAEPDKFCARFTQTILINSDSASLKNIDKDKGVMYVDARVLDYLKELNGVEIKGQFPFAKQFEFKMDFTKPEQCKKIVNGLFKVRKGVTQITFEGEFVTGGATVQATWDDVPQDIKDLVEWGVYTEEEALAKCSTNGGTEQRMILTKPYIKMVEDKDGNKTPVIQKFEEKYTEDDLYLDYVFEAQNEADELGEDVDDSNTESSDTDDMAWLDALA